jgi:APA family basic amino acid/polyamine antiporter
VVGALLAALTGLSYAELAALFPSAGAEYEFARRAFNEFTGFLAGWMMAGANIVASAAVSIGFGHYVRHFIDVDASVAAVGLLAALTTVVSLGVQRSIWLSVGLVALQVGGLLIVIAAGVPHVGDHSLTAGSTASGVLAGAALVFFAFIGFDEVATLAEETHDPRRMVPLALMLGLGISTALYVGVGIAAVSVVGAEALANSDRPLGLVIEEDLGARAGDVIAVIAIASTTNTTLLLLTTSTRLLFGMSRGGALPRYLGRLGRLGKAPWLAALATFACAVPFTLSGRIGFVAEVTNFAIYAIFIAVNLSVIRLRFLMPNVERAFRIPLTFRGVPLPAGAGIVATLLMMAYLDSAAWILGGLMIASGIAAWFVGPYLGRQPQPLATDPSVSLNPSDGPRQR